MENRESYSPPSLTDAGAIQPWDTLQISTAGGMTAVVLHVYESGHIKVRCPSGHIIVITPDKVVENYGYVPSEFDRVLRLLIKQ